MDPLVPIAPPSRSASWRRPLRPLALLLAAVLSVGTLAAVGSSSSGAPAPTATQRTLPPTAAGSVRMTTANLLSGQPLGKFRKDVAAVMASAPDFVTYNEVPYRPDVELAPPGYAIWRTPGKYQGANPVVWRTDRWTAIAQGTSNITNKWGKTKKQSVHWGVRYANWVTLQGTDGRVVSVIATHFAPKSPITEGLVPVAVNNLGNLVDSLRTSGPVLIGGDFNFHYANPQEYPRALLTERNLTPAYDVLGRYLPTGDHYGATIDYVFVSDTTQVAVSNLYTTELKSDHDAVTVDMSLTGTPPDGVLTFGPGTLVNDPAGNLVARRAVLDLMIKAIDGAPKGAGIHLETASLTDRRIKAAISRAKERGVFVQFLTRRTPSSGAERTLFGLLGKKVHRRQWAVPCPKACRKIERRRALPVARLLVSQSGVTPAVRIDVDAPLSYTSAKAPMKATVTTNPAAYDVAFKGFLKLVGRTY